MDLITPIIAGLGVLGYNMTTDKKQDRYETSARESVTPNNKNSALNTYTSTYSKEIKNAERELAQAKNLQSQDPASTNIIPPFFNDHCSPENTCDVTITRKVPFIAEPPQDFMKNKVNDIMNSPMFNVNVLITKPMESTSGGFSVISKEAFTSVQNMNSVQQVSELSGCTFENTHNNMVPFFGSSVKQNTDLNKPQTTLDRHTGNDRHLQKNKIELGPMFSPYKENPFGTQVSQQRDRYQQSQLKTNLLPLPQIKEAPLPPDAFRGRYKTVNQLQVKQRVTNKTPEPVTGLKVAINSQPIAYNKNKPETSYVSGIERTFIQGPIAQSNQLNYENRRSASNENPGFTGSGFAGTGLVKPGARQIKADEIEGVLNEIDNMLFSVSTDDRRTSEKSPGFRNTGNKSVYNEISREGFSSPNETQRDTTSTYRLNPATQLVTQKSYRNNQRSRTTNKETTLYSYTGDASSNVKETSGFHGKETRKTDKVGAHDYLGIVNDTKMQVKLNDSYEESEIKSNRENISNTRDYTISLGIQKPIDGISIPIGADNYNYEHFKNGITENNAREYANMNTVYSSTERNYGITDVSNVKEAIEVNKTDRIEDTFISQLMNNDFNIDLKRQAKKAVKIKRPIQI